MGELWNRHGGEPVNEGERLVVARLVEELPDGWFVVPSIQIPYRDHPDEIDVVVVGPEYVVLVEVKDYKSRVVFRKQQHLVNGEDRRNPIGLIALKARRFKGKLAETTSQLKRVWVASQVVLASDPQQLEIEEEIAHEVVVINQAAQRLSDATVLLPHNQRGRAVSVEAVLQVLGVHASRRRASESYGGYRTLELLEEDQSGRLYEAEETITGRQVSLRVHAVDAFLPGEERKKLQGAALRAYKALTKLEDRVGGVAEVVGPIDAFSTDMGDVVVVSPTQPGLTLAEFAEAGVSIDRSAMLTVIRDVASGIKAAHAAGIAHRRLDPSAIHVDHAQKEVAETWARVGGWDRAHLGGRTTETRYASLVDGAQNFVAPEIVNGEVESWQAVDLWSLGELTRWIWTELAEKGDRESLPDELDHLVTVLTDTDPDDRAAVSAFELAEACRKLLSDKSREAPGSDSATLQLEDLKPGVQIGDRYRVVDVRGEGATGRVVSVDDFLAGKRFALKVFRAGVSVEMAQQEFGALLDVMHSGIVRVYDILRSGGLTCLKMELLSGPTLREHLGLVGSVDLEVALEWFEGLMAALALLHDPEVGRQLVHRDLKPENLIVEGDSRGLVLLDFGLASTEDNDAAGGTGRYRSATALVDATDPGLDLFAAGVVLHEVLTGRHPFGHSASCSGSPEISDDLPEWVRDILERALNEDPESRFTSAEEFRSVLAGPAPVVETSGSDEPPADDLSEPGDSRAPRGVLLGPKVRLEVMAGSERRVEAETPGGEADVEVTVVRARILAEPGICLDVEWCGADYGEAWVKAVDAHSSPARIHRLIHGLRPGIHPVPDGDPRAFMELRQARIIDDPDWPRLRKVSQADLDDAAEADVAALLRDLGSISVSTRGDSWGDEGRRRTDLCVVFERTNLEVPLAAYALTRVAPLAEGHVGGPPAGRSPVEAGGLSVPWPDLDTQMSLGRGGMGDRYQDDFGYWACHDGNAWRSPRFPFGFLRTALFGNDGAAALFSGKGRLAQRTRRHGPVRAVVIQLGDIALVTDGESVVAVEWSAVPVGEAEGLLALVGASSDPRPLDESAFE
ncbi:MAG: protein kinase [Gemmatimonadales bacterium]|nr:protein kinase [Gemmatimonadales bacterium]MBT7694568.1 protein kinase [Gemmatimonadales bacterium]